MRKKALVSWSSGKDSAWTLHMLRQTGLYEVVGLLTSLDPVSERVPMHGTRRAVLDAQARALGLPLRTVSVAWPCSNQEYDAAMSQMYEQALSAGVEVIAFGDLFLEDIRRYREERMARTGLTPVFPLWGLPTNELAREMLESGLRARIVCIDTMKLPRQYAGRDLDDNILDSMPSDVDRCAERGEFHTVAYGGPMFQYTIPLVNGELSERDGFVYADVKVATAKIA